MPGLGDYPTSTITKLLFLGDSGTGKTGALASLAIAGYNLRILDYDVGLEVLKNLLVNHKEALARVSYIVCTDPMQQVAGKMIPRVAAGWIKGVNAMDNWNDGVNKLGNIQTWGSRDILVIDSLNFMGKSCLRFIQQINGRLAGTPYQSDYGDAQRLLENMVAMLYSDSVQCNVIVNTHVRELGKTQQVLDNQQRVVTIEEEGSRKGFAETGTGRALSPTIGRYFNAVLLADITGSGQSTRRVIRTVPHENIGLKNPAPGIAKPEYPQATGLAEYFAAVRGEKAPPLRAA